VPPGGRRVADREQEFFVELERVRRLPDELRDRVQELEEDGAEVVGRRVPALGELVAEREPVLVDERREAARRAIPRVEPELRERADLGGPVPAVGAVDERRRLAAVEQRRDERGRRERRPDVVEPPRPVSRKPRGFPFFFRLWRPVSRSVWGRFGSFLDR
jgi:hypothetical protein